MGCTGVTQELVDAFYMNDGYPVQETSFLKQSTLCLLYTSICQIMGLNYQSAYNLVQRSLQKIREAYGVTGIWMLILHQLTYLH